MSSVTKKTSQTHYFGIRHHGSGSTARLVSALDRLRPDIVLIEGPADCGELLPFLAHPQMRPPVALLAYATEQPESHFYYPFTEFSPEYQACLWAVKHHATLAFIDLPVSVKLAQPAEPLEKLKAENETASEIESETKNEENSPQETTETVETPNETTLASDFDKGDLPKNELSTIQTDSQKLALQLSHDPISVLANLAGYSDGEAWWNDLLEQHSPKQTQTKDDNSDFAVFSAVAKAMQVLRQRLIDIQANADSLKNPLLEQDPLHRDLVREAFMRQQIAQMQKQHPDKVIAVVCGAWHIPALDPNFSLEQNTKFSTSFLSKQDNELIKSLPKKLPTSKVKTTWIPWTSPRLASHSGYGAGVTAPMWYLHLWRQRHSDTLIESWLGNVAHALRQQGHTVSTASVIEAVRLSHSLAVIRERPSVGFEELTESAIACLCFGEPLVWRQIEDGLLLGNQVGQIPDDMPLAPLLEDLQRLQKQTKLAPEALAKEIAFDLRSDAGLKKSLLLHRLRILGVAWGKMLDTGKSRGTFRERWLLEWQPEYAVELVENLVYGNTIAQASNNKVIETLRQETSLNRLVKDLQQALEADLPQATAIGLERLGVLASQTDSADELLKSLSPLIHLERYGTARAMSLDQVAELVRQLTIKASIALPYAVRHISLEEAQHFHQLIKEAHHALLLGEIEHEVMAIWWQAIADIAHSLHQSSNSSSQNPNPLVAGLCNRLLYQDEKISTEQLADTLQKALSPAIATSESAQFFEGFFQGATQSLLYDPLLLQAVEAWLMGLNGEEFVEFLPLFRRVFTDLDAVERKHLLEKVMKGTSQQSLLQLEPNNLPLWENHVSVINKLLQGQKDWA